MLAKVTGLLADAGISIDAVLQREADEVGGEGSTQTDLIILTHDTREGTMDAAHGPDAGPAHGAGSHHPHPQGRVELTLSVAGRRVAADPPWHRWQPPCTHAMPTLVAVLTLAALLKLSNVDMPRWHLAFWFVCWWRR